MGIDRGETGIVYCSHTNENAEDGPRALRREAVSMERASDILQSYLRVTQHLSQQFRNHFSQYNLTFPQAMVMTVLGETGPVPISALAERTGSANSTISGIIDRLERLGLARRERSATDRRVIYVVPTEEYRATARETLTSVNEYFDTIIRDLSAEEREEIRRAMTLLDDAIQHQGREDERIGQEGEKI